MKVIRNFLVITFLLTQSCSNPLSPSDNAHIYHSDYEFLNNEPDNTVFTPPVLTDPALTVGSAPHTLVTRAQFIFSNMTYTKYEHYGKREMNDQTGRYVYDCSGFVGDFVIKQVLPKHYENLKNNALKFHPDIRPRAWGFYDYFNHIYQHDPNNKYWHVFTNPWDLQKGDIIVVKYDESWRNKRISEGKHTSTGHVMLAWGHPVQDDILPYEFTIKVLDSAGSGHYNDTRDEPGSASKDGSGIGHGWMKYKCDLNPINPKAIEYRWKLSTAWYERWDGGSSSHKRLEGIIFARPRTL